MIGCGRRREKEDGKVKVRMWDKSDAETATAAKSLQSCLTLSDPTDGSPPGSTIPGIFQARELEWDAETRMRIES